MSHSEIDLNNAIGTIEIREIYDGWSIAVMRDGQWLNRWNPVEHPRRYAETKKYIDANQPTTDAVKRTFEQSANEPG